MAEKTEKTEKAGAEGESKKAPQPHTRREEQKSRWTLEVCKKAARRFSDVDGWRTGAPSSYKAAESRGWVMECAKGFRKAETTGTGAKTTRTGGKKVA